MMALELEAVSTSLIAPSVQPPRSNKGEEESF